MKYFVIEMKDGSRIGVPVEIIARSRATSYASEHGGDVEKSMAEDTMPLFEADDYAVEDWAVNNMNWSDVKEHAVQLKPPTVSNDRLMQDMWMESEKSVMEAVPPLPDAGEEQLFGVAYKAKGGGSNFLAVIAATTEDARNQVIDELELSSDDIEETEPLIDMINSQYDRIAVLGCV